ncbi:MAG: efflux RND transporter permease subunit [Thermoanaerobaculia bacterium]|nr:efflux RND transporter permease subunit [Thermoanaerobaculia bacterium]
MKVVESAIRFPVKVAVGALLLVLFGFLALLRIPVQLTPTVDEPEVTVSTIWPGASPQEVEREIVDEQEEQLKGLEGLLRMESTSSDSRGSITLTFRTGTDVDTALLKVSNRLEQVPRYPQTAEKPVISSGDVDANASAWFVLLPAEEDGFTGDIDTLLTFFEELVKPELERVPGVAAVNYFGGRERELHVVVDPDRLAARGITLTELMAAIEAENRDFSAGDFDEGLRRYVVRTVGEYQSPDDVADIVVAVRNGVPVFVRDVARVEPGFAKRFARIFYMGEPTIAFNAIRAPGANLLSMMAGVKEALGRLDRELLADRGLRVEVAYDSTEYIDSAIALVLQSLVLGGFLAIVVLLLFLRSRSSTLVVAIAIPISVIGTFLMMSLFGRTLNVISLAGMAFAVGMVVDNSIVVLENTYRHRQMGKSRFQAAYDGTREVWGAVLASTLTTIAVFVPVLFVQEEAGQLFRDIALAIACAVGLSLIVAMTVIPSLASKILGTAGATEGRRDFRSLWGGVGLARRFNGWVTERVYWICGTTARRIAVVVGFTVAALLLTYLLVPKAEYLPTGNQNFLFGVIQTPPGQSVEENAALQQLYIDELRPLWETPPQEARELPGGGIADFFYGAVPGQVFMGISAREPERVRELMPEFQRVNGRLPGSIAFVFQSSLFQRSFGSGRTIDVELTGPRLERLVSLGGEVFERVMAELPGAQARPVPSLDLSSPEVHVRTNRRKAAEVGLTHRDLATMVNVLVDGAKASDYQFEGTEVDLKVTAPEALRHRTHLIQELPIATPSGELVTVGSVATVEVSGGPTEIAHKERQRAITIQVTPPEELPLQTAMERIDSAILQPLRAEGRLSGLYRARLTGTADKLTQTADSLKLNFVLAIVITYLLMAALFESFLYPFVILFSVPLAALGGFLGLGVVNLFTYQALDVLTMLGFIILVGTVVNNAILIVHQSLNHIREDGLAPREAIREATGNRIRPIFMSVSTSVCGMLPLVLFPGAGSELYRGLGSVVVGGLLVSTLFTLFLVPALFSLVLDLRQRFEEALGRIPPLAKEA